VSFGGSILRIEQKEVDIVVIAMKQHKVDYSTINFVCDLHKVPIIAFCDV